MHQTVEQLAPHLGDVPERRQRWAFLTEGMQKDSADHRGRQKRIITECMLENQARHFANEARLMGLNPDSPDARSRLLVEETLAANTGAFTTFALPMIRRVVPRMMSTELFTVQPMSQPTGKAFYFDVKYGSGVNAGQRVDLQAYFSKTYADSSEGSDPNELNMAISSTDISAVEKKLKVIWSIEAQQDLAAYHQMEMEPELMTAASAQIVREVDRILIEDCLSQAGAGNINFNVSGSPSSLPTEQRAYNEKLYESMIDANNLVFKKRYRNPTWVVADVDTCARLEKLQGFKLVDAADNTYQIQHGGRHLFGTLQNRWLIYKDPWFTANKMLFGYKGESPFEAGYGYFPYVPLYTTPLFLNPATMKPVRGLMSRFAYKMLVSEMYSTLTLTTS